MWIDSLSLTIGLKLVFLQDGDSSRCIGNRLPFIVMVAIRSKFLKPHGDCILKPLCFFGQFVLVKFEDCVLKLAFPLWVFQFSVSHRSSSDQTSVGKRAKHALGAGFGRGVAGAGTWTIRGDSWHPLRREVGPRHAM